jgi:hypothetical protein
MSEHLAIGFIASALGTGKMITELLVDMQVAPVTAVNLWEFCVFFCSYYLCNRLFMWCLHRACEGGDQEMWRGSQQWVWIAPNHVKAICKVCVTG